MRWKAVFDINVNIVDIIISTFLFDIETEDIYIDWALRFSEPIKFNNVIVCHQIDIKNIKIFKFVIGMVGLGSSFNLTARQVKCTRNERSLSYFGGYNETKVSLFVWIIIVVWLQKLSKLLVDCWAFFAFDSSSVESTSYFDIWEKLIIRTKLYCFHLWLHIFLYRRHTWDYLLEKSIDAISPSWEYTPLLTCSDGARNITSRVCGIVTRVSTWIESHSSYLIQF